MDLNAIRALIADDMQAVDSVIQQRLTSDVVLINQLGNYIVSNGGKRMRPVITLLSAGACGYNNDQRHILVSAIIEFIHTATLLHDDVVDASEMRRGQETANTIWGNEASVLVGDFLYSRAFEMMVDVGDMRIMEILANTTNTIAEGEVLQLLNINDADTTEESYLEVIHCKTAKLFEAASRLGAVLSGFDQESEASIARYGMHLGTAFQLIDDVLDYTATTDEMGKNVGDDLAEGKPTLPLIYAMRHGNPEQAKTIREAIEKGGLENLDAILATIESTDALTYTSRAARKEADLAIEALSVLPDSPYKEAMRGLADFSVTRSY
ncbi:octaprenyl diphosphate synthase [Solemya pervernicosa gill symbiont]|uniref:Octaprenyl diphosphate synthase n=2 Tax=Gammaproteobacteria incertae sedis TaxID=118884 RepID=A0A1T2L8E0_9GAMM|nr:octaprenyl diphosphate synthase [Candidatus Reidiella endopervernicosa]OOZ41355.1 octaprenyl diphosphate synthase [Solemya pervernicosa gill symbiont]QKQ27733.1 octaprenyl diphosphate synthase [Candidatus Reidiella endopervernicosa]